MLLMLLATNSYAGIDIYTQMDCGPCHEAKNHMQDLGVDFNDKDIAYSFNKKEFDRLGGTGTPLIFVNSDRLDGYDRSELDQALRRNGYIK